MSDELNEPAGDVETPDAVEVEPAEPTRATPAADTDSDDEEELGPKGQQALARMKEARRLAARQKREAIRERDALAAELEELKASRTSDEDTSARDTKAIRKEAAEAAKAQVRAEMLKDRVADKIEVLAAKRAQDPEVVRTLLLASVQAEDFLDGDKIDAEAIKEALDDLLENKPYLAAAQGGRRFGGSGDGGAKPSKPARPKSLGDAVTRHYNR